MRDLESRHYAQAWFFLRGQGISAPRDLARTVLGVVVEVTMNGGLDLLAAYADHHARYFNFSGGGVVWERPDDALDLLIDTLLATGDAIVKAAPAWAKPHPPPPPPNEVRLNVITPDGLHFLQAPTSTIASEPGTTPAFEAATSLMRRLIAADSGARA